MRFYRNKDLTNFIYTDDNTSVIITISKFRNCIEFFDVPFKKMDGALYEESTFDEFFTMVDNASLRFTIISEKSKPKNGQGLKALLSDAEADK
jgi:hypothetical protein